LTIEANLGQDDFLLTLWLFGSVLYDIEVREANDLGLDPFFKLLVACPDRLELETEKLK